MQNLNVTTKAGRILQGRIFKAPQAKTVYIAISGVEGNIYNNRFFTNIGKTLSANGIDFIVGHTTDAFNQVKSFNKLTGKPEIYGAWDERFNEGNADIAAYLAYATKKYEHIILGGQSLGANKVIHYLASHTNAPVDKFFLLSPVNVDSLRDSVPLKQKQFIMQQIRNGNQNKILPFKLFRWLTATANTAYQWLTNDIFNNTHIELRANFKDVYHMSQTGAMLIGTHDGFTRGDPVKYLENINNHTQNKDQNQLIFIDNASHIYRGKEQIVANNVLRQIKNWNF